MRVLRLCKSPTYLPTYLRTYLPTYLSTYLSIHLCETACDFDAAEGPVQKSDRETAFPFRNGLTCTQTHSSGPSHGIVYRGTLIGKDS